MPDSLRQLFRVYLKTVNMPKQRVFSACCAPFSLVIHKVFLRKNGFSRRKIPRCWSYSRFSDRPYFFRGTIAYGRLDIEKRIAFCKVRSDGMRLEEQPQKRRRTMQRFSNSCRTVLTRARQISGLNAPVDFRAIS